MHFAAVCLAILPCLALRAQAPVAGSHAPPAMVSKALPSHGSNLLGVFYLAEGNAPHPTAILFHGFPGFEQNLDLAQAMRRAGWNVLALHYRGSWGVGGGFSFQHCVEDADAEVKFVLDPANAQRYRVDAGKVIVVGHSMGGFMAVSAAAHDPRVRAAVLISAWNIGGAGPHTEADEATNLSRDHDLDPLSGTSAEALAHEEFSHRAVLQLSVLAQRIVPRPVLIVTANDGSAKSAEPFAAALKMSGDSRVVTQHFDTDHLYSGKRVELADSVIAFGSSAIR